LAYTTHNTTSYLWDVGIIVGYEEPTACSAPTDVRVAEATADAGTATTLTWSGATAGNYNPIAGYKVYRSTAAAGEYTLLETVGAGTTSVAVTAPEDMGASFYYKVAVVDTVDGAETLSSAHATLTAKVYTACAAPTEINVDSTSVSPGARVQLSWSGAEAGENNPITAYQVFRADSASGPYSLLTTVGTADTAGSATVVAPTKNGASYYYKVQTVGENVNFSSGQSVAFATLTCSFAATGAPTSVSMSATNVAPGATATLRWSGASDGENNPITGYEVFRATSADGTYTSLVKVTTNATSGSVNVKAPTSKSDTYYYKVRTLGALSGSDSSLSDAYTTLVCTYSNPTAPTTLTADGQRELYIKETSDIRLEWSGAAAGANNPITGYDVYRNGTLWQSNLPPTTSFRTIVPPTTAGTSYTYSVVALGTYNLTKSSKSPECVVRRYSDPTAPKTLTASDEMPAAGSRVLLSWSGAAAGGYNDIVGYKVYRASTEGGALTLVASVDGTASSCYVTAPGKPGSYYYFQVQTVGSYSPSALSSKVAVVGAREATGGDDSVEVIVPAPTARERRGFIFGDYRTATKGWTLASWSFPEPDTQTSYIEVIGRIKGPIDSSTVLTGGDPRYGSRKLTVKLEHSEGNRLERETIITEMVNRLHGQSVHIVFPDDPTRYAVGRLSVHKDYNDPAHAAVSVTAVCEPWRYSQEERRISLLAVEEEAMVVLHNAGRCLLVPEIVVTGGTSRVVLASGEKTWTLTAGTYRLPELTLPRGNTILTYQGLGDITISYREAII